jgi:diacylglycerol kinase family enzyme
MEHGSGTTAAEPRPVAATLALVANEASGTCDPALCATRLRSFGAEVEHFRIEDVERAAAAGADRLVLAGGDGSIAPAAAAAGEAGLPLALIPAGTANDFAHRLGLPLELSAACRLAVRGTSLRSLELGWMEPLEGAAGDRRPFVNVASAGLPAPAAERASTWKRPLGPLGYAAGAVAAGLTARPVISHVTCDGRLLHHGRAWQLTVAASGAFGAGAEVAEADPADGRLEVVAIASGPRPGLVALAWRLRRGEVTGHRRARHASCAVAEVRVPPGTPFNVDGELVRFGPARFEARAGAFRLVSA